MSTDSVTPLDATGLYNGARRVLSLRARSMSLFERGIVKPNVSPGKLLMNPKRQITGCTDLDPADYCRATARSRFLGIMEKSAEVTQEVLDSYLRLIVDRDLPD